MNSIETQSVAKCKANRIKAMLTKASAVLFGLFLTCPLWLMYTTTYITAKLDRQTLETEANHSYFRIGFLILSTTHSEQAGFTMATSHSQQNKI